MEANGQDRKWTVCACEFLGTALFLFGIISTNLPLTIPFSLLASVVIWGDITGGHFNPAVTIGVFTTLEKRSENIVFMFMIIISQIAGGMFGALMSYGGNIDKPDAAIPILAPKNWNQDHTFDESTTGGDHFSMDLNVCINELICTFVFISVILMVKG